MKKGYIGIIVLILLVVCLTTYINHATQEVINITVVDKDRITTGSGEDISSKYIVYTENEVFENTDAITFGKMNSSDIQGQLRIDSTYKVRVSGYRIQFLSSYRNIINFEK